LRLHQRKPDSTTNTEKSTSTPTSALSEANKSKIEMTSASTVVKKKVYTNKSNHCTIVWPKEKAVESPQSVIQTPAKQRKLLQNFKSPNAAVQSDTYIGVKGPRGHFPSNVQGAEVTYMVSVSHR
jgi:hypothetical protein